MEPNRAAWSQLVEDLTKRIQTGEFAPGAKLPDNRALMEHYGVSSSTIDKVMAVLVSLGRVRGERGVGRYAVDPAQWPGVSRNGHNPET